MNASTAGSMMDSRIPSARLRRNQPQEDAAEDGSGGDADQTSRAPASSMVSVRQLADDGGGGSRRALCGWRIRWVRAEPCGRERVRRRWLRLMSRTEGDNSEEHVERLTQRARRRTAVSGLKRRWTSGRSCPNELFALTADILLADLVLRARRSPARRYAPGRRRMDGTVALVVALIGLRRPWARARSAPRPGCGEASRSRCASRQSPGRASDPASVFGRLRRGCPRRRVATIQS